MGRVCEICGKKTQFGNKVARRGLSKRDGGIGLKTTGINSRKFKPNIQNIRVEINGIEVSGLKSSYSEVDRKEPLALIGSSNYLEISVREGNAQEFFGAEMFTPVIVKFPKSLE